ncbi:MAG: hypothetical protein ACYC0Y_02335 [Pirellulales bacterium]
MLFWERARAARALDYVTRDGLDLFGEIEAGMRRGQSYRFRCASAQPVARDFSTLVTRQNSRGCLGFSEIMGVYPREARRRAMYLVMALQAWKCEHGELPATLEELDSNWSRFLWAVGKPNRIDPFTGEPFQYVREGVPWEVTVSPDGGFKSWIAVRYQRFDPEQLIRPNIQLLGESPAPRGTIAFPKQISGPDSQVLPPNTPFVAWLDEGKRTGVISRDDSVLRNDVGWLMPIPRSTE